MFDNKKKIGTSIPMLGFLIEAIGRMIFFLLAIYTKMPQFDIFCSLPPLRDFNYEHRTLQILHGEVFLQNSGYCTEKCL